MSSTEPTVVLAATHMDTERIAETIAGVLEQGVVLHLQGGLGAGKTTFVRGLARGLGLSTDEVSSPSFVRLQRYDDGRRAIVHVDAYRIEDEGEAAGLEIEAIAEEAAAIIAIEWPDRLGEHAPPPDLVVTIDPGEEDSSRRVAILDRRRPAESRRLVDALCTLHGSAVARTPAPIGARCTICGRDISAGGAQERFCSDRCRGADLSRWFRGDYAISRPLDPEEDLEPGSGAGPAGFV